MGYIGSMTVVEMRPVENSTTHITSFQPVEVLKNVPCRLSFSQSPVTSGDDVARISQTVKVFFDPEYAIKAGSKLTVTQNGVTTDYRHSGVEAVYDTHREVELNLFDGWA